MDHKDAITARQKWNFNIIWAILIFLLLAFAIWLFYEVKIRQIESSNKIIINK